jgi:hypothetical protein
LAAQEPAINGNAAARALQSAATSGAATISPSNLCRQQLHVRQQIS